MSDYDKETWQAETAARDKAQTDFYDKMAKSRARSAANAKRKIARLHMKLTELGHISDFEDEFGESVLERLDKFGAAFHDREKGRAGEALSIAQKQVVARMNKKVKDLKAKQMERDNTGDAPDPDADYIRTADRWKNQTSKKSGFNGTRKSTYTPRVRNIEDELIDETPSQPPLTSRPLNPAPPKLVSVETEPRVKSRVEPYIPEYRPKPAIQPQVKTEAERPQAKRPFLRLVSKTPEV